MGTQKRSRSLRLIFILLILAVTGAVLAGCAGQAEEAYRTIVIAEVTGDVTVSGDGRPDTAAYAGMALFGGEAVSVAENGSVTLELDGDKYMMAEPGTRFRLEASGKPGSDRTVIHLESGAALTRITTALNEEQSYVVKTPTATISVRGTIYYIEVGQTAGGKMLTLCNTFDGRVLVQPIDEFGEPAQEPRMIGAGYRAGVIEITEEENNGVQSSTFLYGKGGEAEEPIDYNELPANVIRELMDCVDAGEELPVSREQLEQYIIHEHTYADTWSYDETEHWHGAACSHTDMPSQIRRDVAPHSFDGPVEENGVLTYTCGVCGYERQERLEHTHTWAEDWSSDDSDHWHTSTCQHDEALRKDEAVHDWNTGTVLQAATHSAPGKQVFACTVCGYTQTREIPKLNHSWSDWEAEEDGTHHSRTCSCGETQSGEHTFRETLTDATHTQAGSKTDTCTLCGYQQTREIPKLEEHTFGAWQEETSVSHGRSCACGEKQSEAHTFDAGKEAAVATHTTPGLRVYTCTLCGFARAEEIPVLPEHSWSEWQAETDGTHHTRSCSCGETERAEHTFGAAAVSKEATHLASGVKEYSCTVCGHRVTEEIPKLTEHAWGAWEISDTHHSRACPCGETERAEHTMDGGVEGVNPAGDPATVYTCTACPHQTFRKLAQPPAADMSGIFAVDGTGVETWEDAAVNLSAKDSSQTVFLLQDVSDFSGLYGGVCLPYTAETDPEGEMITFQDMTWDLYGHSMYLGQSAPRIYADSVWTIQATGGGMLETGTYGLQDPDTGGVLEGNIVIQGGMFDFDPTEYVPGGYTVKMVLEPDFIYGEDWEGESQDYAALLKRYVTYSALINSRHNTGGEYYQCRNAGLWIVYPTGKEPVSCDHNTYSHLVYGEKEVLAYCSACGTDILHHVHTGGVAENCLEQAVCTVCSYSYGEYGPHPVDPGVYESDSTQHWQLCQACKENVNRENHSGGTATYVSCAQCAQCGVEYGGYRYIEPADRIGQDILSMQILGQDTGDANLATNIRFRSTDYDSATHTLGLETYLDDVLSTESEKYGMSYTGIGGAGSRAHGFLTLRPRLYTDADSSAQYQVRFTLPSDYSVILVSGGGLQRFGSEEPVYLDTSVEYIISLRKEVADDLMARGSFAAQEFMSKYAANDPYGCLVLAAVFEDSDVSLELGGEIRKLAWSNNQVFSLMFDEIGSTYSWVEILPATEVSQGARSDLAVPVYSLGSISQVGTVTSSCQEGHAEHMPVTGELIRNEHLAGDGSSTIRFRGSAVALPEGTDASGNYNHFAEAWYNNVTSPRIFFYFTLNDTLFCYYADLERAEDDLSGETLPCYDKTASEDFGWTEAAIGMYNEYFGNGGHTKILQLG